MARGKSADGTNKMQLVRDALASLGPKAKPKEIQKSIQDASGVLLATSMISSYKSMINKPKKGSSRKPGRPSKSSAMSAGSSSAKASANIADDVILIRKLIGRLGAKQLSDLVDVLK